MAINELIRTLKENRQIQIDEIWQQAKAEAESYRKRVDDELVRISEEHAERLVSACRKSIRSILSDAEIRARQKKLFVYRDLEETLRKTAVKILSGMRSNNYEDIFAMLVKELPEDQWETILVNPSDVHLAAKYFQKNTVHPDDTISGGIKSIKAGGKMVVDNTFEKRLERIWPSILPEMIKRIEAEYGTGGSSEKN